MDRDLLRMAHHFRPYGHHTPGVRSRIGVALEEMASGITNSELAFVCLQPIGQSRAENGEHVTAA